MAALPDEIMGLLSVHGPVRVEVGDGPAPVGASLAIAPLHRQIYLFARPGSAIAAAIEASGQATLVAENPGEEYLLRVTGRVVLGRPVNGEARRSELVHWLPAGAAPQETLAVRFHPEKIDYVTGRGDARKRATGIVPGGELPAGPSRWLRLAREGVLVWYFIMLAVDWIGLLVLQIPEGTRVVMLGLMIVGGASSLGGVAILNQRAVYLRYREGIGREGDAALVLEGWAAPAEMRAVGLGALCVGPVLALILAAGGAWPVGVLLLLGSGVLLFGPFFGVQHLFRHKDVESP